MAVYIDDFEAPYRNMRMCHMIADSTEELLEMADKIGVDRKWIQYPTTANEHFDICLTKKKKAVLLEAKEIGMRDYARMVNERKGADKNGFLPHRCSSSPCFCFSANPKEDREKYFKDAYKND